MKRLICAGIILAAFAVFTACESATEPVGNELPTNNGTAPGNNSDSGAIPTAEGFSLTVQNGFTILMNMDIENVLDSLGEPSQVFTAPSCAFDGEDRIFLYPGMQLHTWPDGGIDRVHTINIRDDSRRTNGGILLGDSYADVIAAYGDNYAREQDMLTFTRGRTTLSFFMDGDTVISILFELLLQ